MDRWSLWGNVKTQVCYALHCREQRTSPVAKTIKYLPIIRETQVQSLGWEDLLEKEMGTHSSTLAWKIPWMEERGWLQSTGLQIVGHDWATLLTHKRLYIICLWLISLSIISSVQFSCSVAFYSLRPHGLQHARPSCPSRSIHIIANGRMFSFFKRLTNSPLHIYNEQRSLAGYSPWGRKESDTT